MKPLGVILAFIVLSNGLMIGADSPAEKQGRLLRDEYAAVAIILNEEQSALGEREVYPVCVSLTSATGTRDLVRYLRQRGSAVSEPSVCNPSRARGDYPHGTIFTIMKLTREHEGQLEIAVTAVDNNIHNGVHFAALLRKGTYSVKRSSSGEWKIAGYTNQDDSSVKTRSGCESDKSASPKATEN